MKEQKKECMMDKKNEKDAIRMENTKGPFKAVMLNEDEQQQVTGGVDSACLENSYCGKNPPCRDCQYQHSPRKKPLI